ncbi:predicted protein [Naegleria gruberi]|uniref:Predicted protein n=1 Tax=Naegleria gruberi TaxID=5762 RepID=D2VJW9_NAEGR|nr:uncharacterized protein NAEGRDRAFT_69189 [Naegleria gruberi]EFC42843.1 predicted protein [Naegleria gruberi]|eukprot:XP_002675587.1 predicted protein [Naegleria gruberi strain NEG-M]
MSHHNALIITACLFAILLIVNYSTAIHPRSILPAMVNQKDYPTSCCLPRKISLKGSTMQVGFAGNETNTYFATWTINDDLDNGKARTDVTNSNIAPNTTIISYRNGQLTYSYTIIWGQTCFCVKTAQNNWSNNYCTIGKLLEESNIGFNKAQKYGTETIMQRGVDRYISTEYYWTLPIDQQSCVFASYVQAITQPEGSFSKNVQFSGASYQLDPKLFTIPDSCPPESQCRTY